MPNYFRFFALSILVTVFLCIFPESSFATSLSWTNTYSFNGNAGYVKFSSFLNQTVYAAIHPSGNYDILKSSNNGISWSSIKANLPPASDINWISDYPGDPNIIAVSLWGAGVYLTENGGVSWNQVFISTTSRAVQIDPTDLNIIFVGIGGSNSGTSGLYKTIDKGSSWTKQTPLGNRNVAQITIDPNNHLRIFSDADPNFYRTDNGGSTWTSLPLDHVYSTGTVISSQDITSSTLLTGRYDINPGVYKSTNNGGSWLWKNNGLTGTIFHLSEDQDGDLFATRVGSGGGVWRSEDGAESWENVADPAWGGANTWGLDVKDGRIAVSVEGLGLFVADTNLPTPTPTPAPGPHPIVVVPGFGGSYSTKAFVEHQPTVQSDWQMMPFQAPSIYNPFLNALARLNYLRGDKVFFFAYDFTKSIADSAAWLNDYLGNEVISRNPGHRVDVVGHSMGGLVIRYCFESIAGCKDKINKIVSAGTPHKGAVDGYFFWEGADLSSLDPQARFGSALLLQTYGFPTLNPVQIIHEKIPGARDFLPIFDYIAGKPYADLSDLGKNPVLASLPLSGDFSSKTLALSGDRKKSTAEAFNTQNLNRLDQVLGLWLDGKPKKLTKNLGDGTVLASSSNVPGAINKSYSIKHDDYLRFNKSEGDILQFLGLSPIGPLPFLEPNSVSVYYSTDPNVEIQTTQEAGEEIVQPDPNVLFVKGGKARQRKFLVRSKKDGEFEVKGFYYETGGVGKPLKPFKVKLLKNIFKNI